MTLAIDCAPISKFRPIGDAARELASLVYQKHTPAEIGVDLIKDLGRSCKLAPDGEIVGNN
jgi:hypothetical protein